MRRIVGQFIVGLVVLCAGVALAGPPAITGLRHGTHDGQVRLIFEMTEAPGFTAFQLTGPDRLVIDMARMDWAVDGPGPVPGVRAVRHGLLRPDAMRVVVELDRPLRMERIYTRPPRQGVAARLIVDLAPVDRAAYDAIAGWPEKARRAIPAPAPPEPTGTGEMIVSIDPGHGGVDPGARFEGLLEKRVVLAFSLRLAQEIDAMPGFRAVLTRTDDSFVPLAERIARAHRARAGALISVHADVLEEGLASGISVYTLSGEATDRSARALAERENRAEVLAGADLGGESDDLARLLITLAQRGTSPRAERLAGALLEATRDKVKQLRTRPHRHANFRVLKAPDIPSVLLELGFMNSASDRRRMRSRTWRLKAAKLIASGIRAWHEGRDRRE